MNENTEVDEDYGNFTRKNTPYPKQLKEMENVAKHLVKEPDTIRKMVSSSSLASSNKGNLVNYKLEMIKFREIDSSKETFP